MIPLFLRYNADFGLKQRDRSTVLHYCAALGYLDFIKALLSHVPELDLSPKNSEEITPFHGAALNGKTEFVRWLIEMSGPSLPNVDQNQPIHDAAHKGHADILRLLVSPFNVNLRGIQSRTVLCCAALGGSLECVEILLDNGADINMGDSGGWSPLMYALLAKDVAVAELLLKRGAETKAATKDNVTPLHIAAKNGIDSIVHQLLQCGCSTTDKSIDGWTPLLGAVENDHEGVVDRLLTAMDSKGVNYADTVGYACVHAAASNGNGAIIAKLAAAGADCRVAQSSGWTAMHYAAKSGHFDIVDALIGLDLSLDSPTMTGDTPATIAASSGSLQFLSVLRGHKVVFSELNPLTHTSLVTKAWRRPTTIKKLVSYGSDPQICDIWGMSIFDYIQWSPSVQKLMALFPAHQPLSSSERQTTVKSAFLTSVNVLLRQPYTLNPEQRNYRILSLIMLRSSLYWIDDNVSTAWGSLCISEGIFRAATWLEFYISYTCQICHATLSHSDLFDCTGCFDHVLCGRCYAAYETCGKHAPTAVSVLEGLELEVREVRIALYGIRGDIAELFGVIFGGDCSSIEQWHADKVVAYDEW
jgi:ankyrin repeat protein